MMVYALYCRPFRRRSSQEERAPQMVRPVGFESPAFVALSAGYLRSSSIAFASRDCERMVGFDVSFTTFSFNSGL